MQEGRKVLKSKHTKFKKTNKPPKHDKVKHHDKSTYRLEREEKNENMRFDENTRDLYTNWSSAITRES